MKKRFIVFFALFIILLALSIFEGVLTSYVAQGSAPSNVSVDVKFISITFSDNLSDGIAFDEVSSIPSTNVNATDNYNSPVNGTTLFIMVSNDSSSDVDFCIQANADLTDPNTLDIIGLGNETYSNSSSTNIGIPSLIDEISLTTSYVKSSSAISPGNENYYRFWLDVPLGTSAGSYNNTISFKGVETSASC